MNDPCDNLYYHPTNVYPSLHQLENSVWPCLVNSRLEHKICFGQWNVSGHDLIPIPTEAWNVLAWFGLASWTSALCYGKTMPQGAAASLAEPHCWKPHWLLLFHLDALIQLCMTTLRTAGHDNL